MRAHARAIVPKSDTEVVAWWWRGGGVVVAWWWRGGGVVVAWWWRRGWALPRSWEAPHASRRAMLPEMTDEQLEQWLRDLIARHDAIAGTVHFVNDDHLAIAATVNIPPKVQELTAKIPLGKGMAGLSWQHDKPIQTCNLQDDTSGAVRPGAKAVDARAAVALPVHDASGAVHAVVGLAWADERVLADDALARIVADAETLAA